MESTALGRQQRQHARLSAAATIVSPGVGPFVASSDGICAKWRTESFVPLQKAKRTQRHEDSSPPRNTVELNIFITGKKIASRKKALQINTRTFSHPLCH